MPNRIRELREARDLSQEELGAMVGTGNQQISKLERGALRLSQPWIDKLSKALRVRPYELLNDPFGEVDPVEMTLLERFRQLHSDQKNYVLQTIDMIAKRDETPPKKR